MNKYIFLLLVFFCNVCSASAGTITSVVIDENNETLTINGTGFGTYTDNNATYDYLCAVWENLETNGYISSATSDLITTGNGPELITDSNNKTNSTACGMAFKRINARSFTNMWNEAKSATGGGSVQHTCTTGAPWPKVIFMSGYFMFPENFTYDLNEGTVGNSQCKFMTVYPTNDQGVDNSKTYWNVQGDPAFFYQNWEDKTASYGNLVSAGRVDQNVTEGTWDRFDILVDTSRAEGEMVAYFYLNGKLITDPEDFYYVEQDTCCSSAPCDADDYGCPRTWEWLRWIQYIVNYRLDDGVTWDIYLDDMYASYTWQRVEMSDRSSWNDSSEGHLELQPPTSWSDTQIVCRLNKGAFLDGSTVYINVIDEINTASNTKSVTLSGAVKVSSSSGTTTRVGSGTTISAKGI